MSVKVNFKNNARHDPMNEGNVHMAAGRLEEARLKFLEVISQDAGNTEAWFKAGLAYYCTDDHNQDPGMFIAKAYKQKPNNPAIQAAIGFWLLTKKDRQEEGLEELARAEKDFFMGPLVQELRKTPKKQLTPEIVKDLISQFDSYEEQTGTVRTRETNLQAMATLEA